MRRGGFVVSLTVELPQTYERDKNITIMLGVMRHQGQDIKRTFERLETIDTRLDQVENMLAQILARLPEKP